MDDSRCLAIVDFDNVRSNVKCVPGWKLPWWLMQNILDHTKVAYAFALTDFTLLPPDIAQALVIAGFSLLHCPKTPIRTAQDGTMKDTVDVTAIDTIERVMQYSPAISTIVLCSGDRDFLPVLSRWRMEGKKILVIGHSAVSRELHQVADKVVDVGTPAHAIEDFRPYLTAANTVDYEHLPTASLRFVRNGLTQYVKRVLVPYNVGGREKEFTQPFLYRGLRTAWQFESWSDADIRLLLELVLETILCPPSENGHEVLHRELDLTHPFVIYASGGCPASELVF